MIAREQQNHEQFGVEPALTECADIISEYQSQYPDDNQRRVEDDLAQLGLAFNPFAIFFRPDSRFLMIDEETRHHEQAGHPEDDKDDMSGF